MAARTYNALNGIILAAFIMLLFNSYNLFNIGFLLSFAATSGIVFLKQDIEDKMPQKIKWMREEIAVSLSAFIATLPIILWYKGTFSIFSIIVNIIISPVISIITVVGFVSGFVYALIGVKEILYPGVLLGEIFLKAVRCIYSVNMPLDTGRPPVSFIALYYITLLIMFGYIKIKKFKYKKYTKTILIILTLALFFYRAPGLKVHFIDVGQGDSILIQTPDNHNILIDSGPQFKDYMAVENKVIPYLKLNRCSRIDMMIITHFHNDHAGGIEYFLNNYKVSKLLSFTKPQNFLYDVEYIMAGDSIKVDDVEINVLFPEGNAGGIDSDDVNETCLVMEVKYRDFSMLLTADAVKEVMDKVRGEYDIFKVPHHGSIYSLSMDMLDKSKIGTAVISVGKNSFGHPSPIVINELKKRDVNVYRTDLNSNITILTDGKSYRVLSQTP
jgi:competence protein ComEC